MLQFRNLQLLLLILILASCYKAEKNESVNVEAELQNLTDKNEYLEYIYTIDQEIRGEKSSELLLEFGENSEEYKNFLFKMDSIDGLNYKRIELFLENFDYPDKKAFSKNATLTPWLVIHHNLDLEKRLKNFDILHKAYQNENLSISQFDLYLRRTYNIKHSKKIAWEGAYNPVEKIEWMIKELELKPME